MRAILREGRKEGEKIEGVAAYGIKVKKKVALCKRGRREKRGEGGGGKTKVKRSENCVCVFTLPYEFVDTTLFVPHLYAGESHRAIPIKAENHSPIGIALAVFAGGSSHC